MCGPVFTVDHEIRIPKSEIDLALVDRDLLEADVGFFGIVIRRRWHLLDRHALVDVDQRVLVGVPDEQDRLGDVANLVDREARLIGIDQRDVVRSGNVAVIGDDEAVAAVQTGGRRWCRAEWWSESSLRRSFPGRSGRRCTSPRR